MLFRRYVTHAGIPFRLGTGVEANFTRTLADLLCTQVRVGLPLAYLLCTQVRVGLPLAYLLCTQVRVGLPLAYLLCTQVRVGPTLVRCAYR